MYDVAVLGGGPGGYSAALRAAVRGAKVCCIEADKIGGTCLNTGCIPTKTMLHAGSVIKDIESCSRLGITTDRTNIDGKELIKSLHKTVADLAAGVRQLLKARSVDIICGRGRLLNAHTISAETSSGTERIEAGTIIIATGARPIRPAELPWDSGRVITTNEATTTDSLPQSVVIIGSGVIGCEFATIYSQLGIPVTLVEMLDILVPEMDEEVSGAVFKGLQDLGVDVHLSAKLSSMTATADGIKVELDDGNCVGADKALVAIGRTPNTENIGLENLGIELDGQIIRVDDHCRTNIEGVYAVGDAAERRQYAHLAGRMGTVAADNATGNDTTDSRDVVPACIYTRPEAATVGLSEALARNEFKKIRIGRFPYSACGIAHIHGNTEGLVKIIAAGDTGRIIGGVIIGPRATETINEIALAMRNGLTVQQIAETIRAHPTFSEAVREAADALMAMGLPLHIAKKAAGSHE